MATKRKKSGELWPVKLESITDNQSLNTDQLLPKYIELKTRIEQLEGEKDKNLLKLKQLEQTIQEADSKCTNHLEQLSELKSLVAELEIKLEKKSEQYNQAIKQLKEEKEHYLQQEEKWQIFQKDLLTTVRVANDLKTEAEEKIVSLEQELSKLKVNKCSKNSNDLLNKSTDSCQANDDNESNCSLTGMINSNGIESKTDSNKNCEQDAIVFRRPTKEDDAMILGENLKRNNCFAESNVLNCLDKTKLIRQQSADSVFSNIVKHKSNQRNSSQSLILNAKNKISVKSLVEKLETIENASKSTGSNSIVQSISKSPSFNSINVVNRNEIESKTTVFSNSKSSVQNQLNGDKLEPKSELKDNKLDNHKHDHQLNNDRLIINNKTPSNRLIANNNLINSNKKENYPINLNNNHTEQNALNNLIKDAGSIRNGLLRWCKKKTEKYDGIEISNFSSSWKDSLVICALLHSLDPTLIPFQSLDRNNKKKNFMLAFKAAESIGIQCNLNIEDLINEERPDWSKILAYVTSIYCHFEVKNKSH